MQLFVCSVYITKTGPRYGIRTLFNILIVHFVMKFQFCLTCIPGRDEYWKLVTIWLLLLSNDILEFYRSYTTFYFKSLKVRSLELNSSTGKIDYRIHNFNVIQNLKLQVSQYQLILQMTSYLFELRELEVMKLQQLVPLVKKIISAHYCSHQKKRQM